MENARLSPAGWFRRTFIGDRQFYRAVIALILPIIVQNTVSNVVNLLDNVMVGSLGTIEMSGVAIANQLMFVYNLAIFGGIGGAGIFGAQFVGAGDGERFRETVRYRLGIAFLLTALGCAVLYFFRDPLISLYLTGEGSPEEAQAMLRSGHEYLGVILLSLLPFAVSQCYSSSLRETGETVLPMVSSIAAVLVNLVFNYLLIFGKFGFPALGVKGAAIATALSRFVELGILLLFTHAGGRFPFMKGVYSRFRIERKLLGEITVKSMPLLLNEFLWSFGMTTLTAIYSTCGLTVVAALNISSTIANIFNTFFFSTGTAVAVMVGQALGSDDIEGAKLLVWKITFFAVALSASIAVLLYIAAAYIPDIYNTEQSVRALATSFMRTGAVFMVFHAIAHCCYFTLRSGGKTIITMLFDCGYTWIAAVPAAYLLVHTLDLPISTLYFLSMLVDVVKAALGVIVVRTGLWARNIASGR